MKVRFSNCKNFALFYGYDHIEQLGSYDLVVVEPLAYKNEDIMQLKSKGIIVVAYFSLLEIHPDSPYFGLFSEHDFLRADDQLIKNEYFGTYIIDLRLEKCRSIQKKLVEKLIDLGYDGIFVDTVSSAELAVVKANFGDKIAESVGSFVKHLKDKHQQLILIQNNGFADVIKHTKNFIDAICWENPSYGKKGCVGWTNNIDKMLLRLEKRKNIKIMLLEDKVHDETKNNIVKDTAFERGWLYYNAPGSYVTSVKIL